ncbi:MAG: cytidylate kinase-like family protein [Oscillospiraceae bacterium]|nr:cytidylate kinase-like family protein [Oscillospiraceae bacterium]
MAAQESGLSLDYINQMEQHMSREIVYDLRTASYALSNEGLPPEERLFAAQAAIIRRIGAGDESCVIMGRCADYVLYDDPNCFRIFIHAIPEARKARLKVQYGLSDEQAQIQMQNTDASRARHYKHFTGRNYGSQQYYHLGVDSSQLGTDGAVQVIMDSIRLWCDVRGTYPLHTLMQPEK